MGRRATCSPPAWQTSPELAGPLFAPGRPGTSRALGRLLLPRPLAPPWGRLLSISWMLGSRSGPPIGGGTEGLRVAGADILPPAAAYCLCTWQFQWFLMALSVRPGICLAISAHRLPRRACSRASCSSSSGVKGVFLMAGSK